jgi:hypothetical protein
MNSFVKNSIAKKKFDVILTPLFYRGNPAAWGATANGWSGLPMTPGAFAKRRIRSPGANL